MMGKPMRFMKCSSSQYEELKANEGLNDNTFYFVSRLSSENTPVWDIYLGMGAVLVH